MSASDQELSQDLLFDLLSNRRRRFVLHYLLREDRPVSIQELSKQVAMWEFGVTDEELSDQQKKRIYVALYQTHVPKLEEAGVIEYDSDTGLVEIAGQARQLEPYLEEGAIERRPWHWYFVGLSVASVVFFLAVATDIAGFAALTEFQGGLVVVTAFIVLSVAYYLSAV